jgi:hypothetical protein
LAMLPLRWPNTRRWSMMWSGCSDRITRTPWLPAKIWPACARSGVGIADRCRCWPSSLVRVVILGVSGHIGRSACAESLAECFGLYWLFVNESALVDSGYRWRAVMFGEVGSRWVRIRVPTLDHPPSKPPIAWECGARRAAFVRLWRYLCDMAGRTLRKRREALTGRAEVASSSY